MRRWQWLPLRDDPMVGVLVSPDGKAQPARCLTPEQAKAAAVKKARVA